MTQFDEDTHLERQDDGSWTGTMTDRWWIGGGHNGGYIASFLIRAMTSEAGPPDPLTMTTHFLARLDVASVRVVVERLHATRNTEFLQARMLQAGTVRAVATAAFGRFREDEAVSLQGDIPRPPDPDHARTVRVQTVADMTFRDRFEYRIPEASGLPFITPEGVADVPFGTEPGPARVGGWMRFADGRPLDPLAVPLFMDSWPPPMFATFLGGFAPTLELTVHWRGRPRTTWHLARFHSRFLVNGYTDEDGELWDEEGQLVAISRQLARFSPPDRQPAVPPAQPPAAG